MFFQLKIAANRRQGLFREDFGKFLICGRLHFVLTCEISRSLVTEGSTCSSYLTEFVCLFVYLFVARTCNRYAVIRACADKGAIMFRISCSVFSPAPIFPLPLSFSRLTNWAIICSPQKYQSRLHLRQLNQFLCRTLQLMWSAKTREDGAGHR